jgi:hypothetical protein
VTSHCETFLANCLRLEGGEAARAANLLLLSLAPCNSVDNLKGVAPLGNALGGSKWRGAIKVVTYCVTWTVATGALKYSGTITAGFGDHASLAAMP